jgi:hypothetical protein
LASVDPRAHDWKRVDFLALKRLKVYAFDNITAGSFSSHGGLNEANDDRSFTPPSENAPHLLFGIS